MAASPVLLLVRVLSGVINDVGEALIYRLRPVTDIGEPSSGSPNGKPTKHSTLDPLNTEVRNNEAAQGRK